MEICIVSNQPSRRTDYFIRAGESVGQTVRFITYDQLLNTGTGQLQYAKLEPPVWQETGLLAYHQLCTEYIQLLKELSTLPTGKVRFLNSPGAILRTLDKVGTKKQLAGLPVTPVLLSHVAGIEQLEEYLSGSKYRSVFLKPRFGSGAGGVMAIRRHPVSGAWVVYTPLTLQEGIVRNTKRIRHVTDRKEIKCLVNTVCKCDAMLEQWLPKEKTGHENYDLRVVCLNGRTEHIVVRCSTGAITNLHLNNTPRAFQSLRLPPQTCEKINQLSIRAVEKTGLHYGGVDILIQRGTGEPYIIEVNGQGDHIYDDIFNENNIYKNQIREWLK